MPTVLVTGSNRGLGLEFCRQYAEAGWRVVACCRHVDKAEELKTIAGKVELHTLDVCNHPQVEALAKKLYGTPIDVLLNNAGVCSSQAGRQNYEEWAKVFTVNVLGPVKVCECFAEHVGWSDKKAIICIGSRNGSNSQDEVAPYAYATSKAALNRFVRRMAHDMKPRKIIAAVIHPGHVKTDMGGKSAAFGIGESVLNVRRVIDGLELSDSGKFLNFDGEELPW